MGLLGHLLALFVFVFVLADMAAVGDKEHVRGDIPSKRFDKDHYKGGEHDAHQDHAAFLGSKKEAEEYDELPPEESRKRLRVLATKMDVDGDGFVIKEEMIQWIKRSMQDLDREEVEERYDEIDEDKDGKVTWEEYVKDSFGNEEDDKLDADDKKLMDEDRMYFKAADEDGDGFLSRVEYASFQNPEHYDHMHETLVKLNLQEKDKNNDGMISLDEFLGESTGGEDDEWRQTETDRFNNEFDKNKDGKLDREEMKSWLIPDAGQTANDEAEHLFKESDLDKDGRLSIDEIVDQHQLFVGSEATNYGEHLEKIDHTEL